MDYDLLSGLLAFAFVTLVTPGPNNLMLMASGANFGFRRTVPHWMGITFGFGAMVGLVGLGIAGLFSAFPSAYLAMKVVSVVYLLWLAWKIAHSAPPQEAEAGARPLTFVQAAAFQWVNPKAWAMALGAATNFAADARLSSVAIVALVFVVVGAPTIALWTLIGQEMRRFLTNRRRLAVFNWTMAGLLVLSLLPVLWH